MKYNKKDLLKKAIDAIKKHNLFFIEDAISFLPCDKTTFYRYFKVNSNEYNDIKSMLDENKVKTKVGLRAKLFKGKGMELIALYKLIGTEEEYQRLANAKQEVDHKNDGGKFEASTSAMSTDELLKRAEAVKTIEEKENE